MSRSRRNERKFTPSLMYVFNFVDTITGIIVCTKRVRARYHCTRYSVEKFAHDHLNPNPLNFRTELIKVFAN